MREDIYGGLKNALEHGDSLEKAIRSFINAGYKESEVRETANMISTNATSMTSPQAFPTNKNPVKFQSPIQPQKIMPPQFKQQASTMQQLQPIQPYLNQTSFTLKHKAWRPNWIIIILSFILLLSVVAFFSSLLFKQQIADYLSAFLK